mmetsp:Transcript_42213/g.111828  ORF Transcript_42213/g.111828 Transcript_42213/m.111828 type:complete len:253 (-) Transcript_42213:312-1070(-)
MGERPKGELPANFKSKAVPAAEMGPPAFAPVMPKIGGPSVVIVPFPKARLQEMVAAAKALFPDVERWSTDDVLTATVWQALVRVRCEQVGLTVESDEVTTCSRAFNVRQRTEPKLGAGYFANGATQIWTELPVKELCAMSPGAVAQKLRASIMMHKAEDTAARVQWYREEAAKGNRTPQQYDKWALTFILSSWVFDWEAVDFGAKPVAFDHGAIVPIVANFVPRPGGDGLNVYASGPQASTEQFARLLGGSG